MYTCLWIFQPTPSIAYTLYGKCISNSRALVHRRGATHTLIIDIILFFPSAGLPSQPIQLKGIGRLLLDVGYTTPAIDGHLLYELLSHWDVYTTCTYTYGGGVCDMPDHQTREFHGRPYNCWVGVIHQPPPFGPPIRRERDISLVISCSVVLQSPVSPWYISLLFHFT
jgi:hypothetical protein